MYASPLRPATSGKYRDREKTSDPRDGVVHTAGQTGVLGGSCGQGRRRQRGDRDGQAEAEDDHGRKHVTEYEAPWPMRVMPATPNAHNNCPTVMGRRAPTRCANAPIRAESSNMTRVVGNSATPAASGL